MKFLAEQKFRYKRRVKNTEKRFNDSVTIDREAIRKEVRLAIKSQACSVHCLKSIRGTRGRPGQRGSPGKHGPPGPQGVKGLKEIRALRAFKDLPDLWVLLELRASLVNQSQLPQL